LKTSSNQPYLNLYTHEDSASGSLCPEVDAALHSKIDQNRLSVPYIFSHVRTRTAPSTWWEQL